MFPEKSLQLITNDDFFAAIVFLSPRSPQWPLVRGLSMQADAVMEDKKVLTVAFRKTSESIRLLASICEISQDWKSTHIFIQKQKISYIYSVNWLSCYLKSLQCDEPLSWCLSITQGPRRLNDFGERNLCLHINIDSLKEPLQEKKPEEVDFREHFICPCKKISGYLWGYRELPISLKSQLQAFAVERGYVQCPNFDIDHFKPVFDTIESPI